MSNNVLIANIELAMSIDMMVLAILCQLCSPNSAAFESSKSKLDHKPALQVSKFIIAIKSGTSLLNESHIWQIQNIVIHGLKGNGFASASSSESINAWLLF